jgi:cbb3-type cytochrome oxidase maturation protein
MSGLAVLIPIAIAMGLAALVAFLWALRSGQYDDMEGASQRILDRDDVPRSDHAAGPPT